MAERKPAKKGAQRSAKRTTGKASKGFTDEERAAMKERAITLLYRGVLFMDELPEFSRSVLAPQERQKAAGDGDLLAWNAVD